MADKSARAFRTISEVAEHLDLPQHVLRFWETKFPQIQPMKRGGGRRFYRPEDVTFLEGIRALLHEDGYTIKGVQKLLRENAGKLPEIKEMKVSEPRGEQTELRAILSELQAAKALLTAQ